MTSTSVKLDWLQGLRAIAATSVVITHCRNYFQTTAFWPAMNWFFLPFASGVDLFFVISGFIVTISTWTETGGSASSFHFLKQRLQRIWPPYLVVTLIALPVLNPLNISYRLYALFWSLLLLPARYQAVSADQILPQGWTINFEFYFYCIFAGSMLFRKFRWLAFGIWIAITLCLIPFLSTSVDLLDPNAPFSHYKDWPYLRFSTNPIIWEFGFGVAAGIAYKQFDVLVMSTVLARVMLVISSTLVLAWTAYCYNYINIRMGLGFALYIYVASQFIPNARLTIPKWVVSIGDYSYTLYIEHYPLVLVLLAAMKRLQETPVWLPYATFLSTLAFTLLAARVTGPWLERKMPKMVASWLSRMLVFSER